MRVLLLTPPMTQLNTPYPATAYLAGFLKKNGIDVRQADPSILLALKLFSADGLRQVSQIVKNNKKRTATARFFLEHFSEYESTVDSVVHFLQGRDPTLAYRIGSRKFLPEGPRFRTITEFTSEADSLEYAFGGLTVQDRAKYLASLYLDDLADVIRDGIDPRFEFSRYGEKLAASSPTFDPILEALESQPTLVDRHLDEITVELISKHQPDLVGLTAPFPGNVYGAFRIAQVIKKKFPETKIVFGGGYVNTELRELKDPRVFDFVDFITFDDGEKPLLCLIEFLEGKRNEEDLLRTLVRKNRKIEYRSNSKIHDIPHKEIGTPTYVGLPIRSYISLFEMLNPMHRIWSDGRWNKLTLAHGCYWKKCNFCDVTLDYIGRYDPASADLISDRIEALIRETGETGFHFVDEAAPPALLKAMAQRLLERKVQISWWANIRFEKTFTADLVELLAKSGCIAVSGGLEVASDRLLKLMHKGVSVEQVAQVTKAFSDAGILVHAYLMYGFPTQTEEETIDSLERVRQLFAEGCIHSAFWHRFSATAHSPIGKNPEQFGIRLLPEPKISFARNDLAFEDPTGCDHDELGEGLKKAVYNYMHGAGLEEDVRIWFELELKPASVSPGLVRRALENQDQQTKKRG